MSYVCACEQLLADAPTPRRLLSEARRRRVISADNNTYAGARSRYGRARSYDLWIAPPYNYRLFETHIIHGTDKNRTFCTHTDNVHTGEPVCFDGFLILRPDGCRVSYKIQNHFDTARIAFTWQKRSTRKPFGSSREGVMPGQNRITTKNGQRLVESKKVKKKTINVTVFTVMTAFDVLCVSHVSPSLVGVPLKTIIDEPHIRKSTRVRYTTRTRVQT